MQTFPAGDTVTKISGQAATYSSGLNFGPISVTSSTTQGSEVTYIWHFGRATATHRLFGNNGTATSASILYSW
jgi:hypothetical protein